MPAACTAAASSTLNIPNGQRLREVSASSSAPAQCTSSDDAQRPTDPTSGRVLPRPPEPAWAPGPAPEARLPRAAADGHGRVCRQGRCRHLPGDPIRSAPPRRHGRVRQSCMQPVHVRAAELVPRPQRSRSTLLAALFGRGRRQVGRLSGGVRRASPGASRIFTWLPTKTHALVGSGCAPTAASMRRVHPDRLRGLAKRPSAVSEQTGARPLPR